MRHSIQKHAAALIVVIAVVGIVFGMTQNAQAYIPFGGPIVFMRFGNGCIVLTVGPPRPGEYIFQFGPSLLFAYFSIHPGARVLGLATVPIPCFAGPFLIGIGPLILMMGTSP